MRGVRAWDAPTPVPEWSARDVVTHLVGWLPAFLEGGGTRGPAPGPDPATDPVAAWIHHAEEVDEHTCVAMLEGMVPMADRLQASGQYGAPVPVAADAPAQDRLLGLIGRDPAWRPPTT